VRRRRAGDFAWPSSPGRKHGALPWSRVCEPERGRSAAPAVGWTNEGTSRALAVTAIETITAGRCYPSAVMSGLPSVYLETTVISYLTARTSRNLRVAAHQEITADWWARRRMRFELYVSRLVIDEASSGDVEAAARRLAMLSGIPRLELTESASLLAASLVKEAAIPREAVEDALHVAVAAAHGMDYLLTWNCRHIANATMRNRIADVCAASGFETPVICTPEELLED